MKSLNGIQAVVTGGASGIGRATVEALVAKGARVRVISRSADKLEKVKHEVKGAIEIVQGDVTGFGRGGARVGGNHAKLGCAQRRAAPGSRICARAHLGELLR